MIPIYPEGKKTEVPVTQRAPFAVLPPLALYVHIPWCIRKCPYCDFYSHEKSGNLPEHDYLEILKKDLEQSLPLIWERKIHSIFIGGGTPSLLSAEAIDRLLSMIRALVPVLPNAEISIEANPGTFEAGKFKAYHASGINRLSIGIQSFQPELLKRLGRIHDADEAKSAIDCAKKYFDNINLDIMYGLPGQSVDKLDEDIQTGLSFDPTHLSCYQLTIEPNTYYAKHPPVLPNEDAIDEMQSHILAMTSDSGFDHYEVSAYAKEQKQCWHNKNYWQYGDYLGIGAAAHSKLTLPDGRILRQARYRNPSLYMSGVRQGKACEEAFDVTDTDLGFEFMLNALRLQHGFDPQLFVERTGLSFDHVAYNLEKAKQKGLVEVSPQLVKPTALGNRFLNDLQEMFLPK